MAEELTIEQIKEYTGIDANSIEDFKAQFTPKYFTMAQVDEDKTIRSKMIGHTIGNILENTLKVAKGFGVDVKGADIKDKPIEDIFNHILEVKEESHQSLVEEMKGKMSKGADDKFKSLQEDYDKAVGKIKDIEGVNKGMIEKLESSEKDWSGKLKDFKRSYLEKDIFASLDYTPDIDPYKKKGFEVEAREEFKFDFDENESPFVVDKEGNRIANPNKAGEFITPKEALTEYGKKAGVIAQNPKAGRPVGSAAPITPNVQPQTQPQAQGQPVTGVTPRPQTRRLNERAKV